MGLSAKPPVASSVRARAALLLAAGLLAGLLLCPANAGADDGWWSGLDEGEAVSLADVMRGPDDYRDRTLTFYAVFFTASGEFKYYPPGTLFTEASYMNFSVWPDGTPMWDQEAWKQEYPFLYLPRSHVQRAELNALERFTRLEITGRIRHLVRGRPAIEVFSFRRTGHRLGRDVVSNIQYGLNYTRVGTREAYQSAARRFKVALQPDLPPVYAIIVRKYLGDTLRRLGLDAEATRYENGEVVGSPELPDTLPPPQNQPDPFPDERDPRPDDFPPAPAPGAPASSGFGSPDGSSDLPEPPGMPAPGGLPRGFDAPSAPPGSRGATPRPLPGTTDFPGQPAFRDAPDPVPRAAPAAPPRGARPPAGNDAQRRASGIPPRRRPRLNGVK